MKQRLQFLVMVFSFISPITPCHLRCTNYLVLRNSVFIYFDMGEGALVTETNEKDDEKLQATTTSKISKVFPFQFFIKK